MIELIAHNLAPIMFASRAVPAAGLPRGLFAGGKRLIFFVVGVELAPYSQSITLDWPLLGLTIERILDVMRNDTLLAIPFSR
jgi:TRAP-type mannitol/chloroaromatic compound transport system permease large subunit